VPHFVLVPMMAAGPMLILAGRGALVTFVTTPLNLLRLNRSPSDAALPIRFLPLPLPFPCAEAGLPEGCESLDLLNNFNDACAMLRAPLVDRRGSSACRASRSSGW
jgi:hypothetical protein